MGLIEKFPSASNEDDDPDGDGLSNRSEQLAGTDPTDRDSVLELELVARPADLSDSDQTPVPVGDQAVYFRSVPGRSYDVQSAETPQGPWILQGVALASTTQKRFVIPNPVPPVQSFYRVLALP